VVKGGSWLYLPTPAIYIIQHLTRLRNSCLTNILNLEQSICRTKLMIHTRSSILYDAACGRIYSLGVNDD
jgi:hypothetical protein